MEQLRSNCNTLYFLSPGMGFVRMKFSASWDESHYAFRRAPSLIRNNCLTKIPANKTRQIIERPELVTANAVGFTGFQWGPFHLDENVWSAARLQGKSVVEKTSLRKCIRPLVELNAPGHDELRAYLSLLVGRSLSTISSIRFPDTLL
jgi:hypothetical protein